MRRALFFLLAMASCDSCKSSEPQTGAPDASEAAPIENKRAAAVTILEQNCLICHSLDMIEAQRLTRAQWEKELKKMEGWGAQVTDEDRPIVLDYLTANEGADGGPYAFSKMTFTDLAATIAPSPGEVTGDAVRGKAKYEQVCQSCHGEGAKGAQGFGPRLAGRPAIWRKADFEKVLKEGRNRMPTQASNVDAASTGDLLVYLRSL
jgi:mono/diheme cytochrome c family protein